MFRSFDCNFTKFSIHLMMMVFAYPYQGNKDIGLRWTLTCEFRIICRIIGLRVIHCAAVLTMHFDIDLYVFLFGCLWMHVLDNKWCTFKWQVCQGLWGMIITKHRSSFTMWQFHQQLELHLSDPSGWVLSSFGDVWPPTLKTFIGRVNPGFSPDFVFILTVCHSLAVLKFTMFLCQILNSSYILEAVS